jgi:hypothetical protein
MHDEIRSAYAQHGFNCKNCSHFTAGWACAKFAPCMLSVQWIRFLVCPVCDKIVSADAQNAHAIIFEKNCFRTHQIGPKWTFWTKIFLDISKKIWFRVCSVTVKMFELQYSGEFRRKRSEFFSRKFTKGILGFDIGDWRIYNGRAISFCYVYGKEPRLSEQSQPQKRLLFQIRSIY